MLRLSKKADYGLVALLHLAGRRAGQSASAKEIAETYGLPLPLLAKVLQTLTRQGFLSAVYGTNGGYRLARRAESINALDVIRALDGPVILTSCSSKADKCFRNSRCTARGPLEKIRQDILQLLERTTLSEMSASNQRREKLVSLAAPRTHA
jgi:Rrf2 family protein